MEEVNEALKGRPMSAQGNALGPEPQAHAALKGRPKGYVESGWSEGVTDAHTSEGIAIRLGRKGPIL